MKRGELFQRSATMLQRFMAQGIICAIDRTESTKHRIVQSSRRNRSSSVGAHGAEGADHTHLNAEGRRMIGEIVAREFIQLFPNLADETRRELTDSSSTRADPASALGGLSVPQTESTISIVRGNSPVLVYNIKSPPVPSGIDPVLHAPAVFYIRFTHPPARPSRPLFPLTTLTNMESFQPGLRQPMMAARLIFGIWLARPVACCIARLVETFNHAAGSGFEVELVHQTASEPIVDVLHKVGR